MRIGGSELRPKLGLVAGVAVVIGLIVTTAIAAGDAPSGNRPVDSFASSETTTLRAFEVTWVEQTTERRYVEEPYTCEGVLYCENPFPSGHWETVQGPALTRTDVVCARSIEEARRMVAADVTITGRTQDPAVCAESEPAVPDVTAEGEDPADSGDVEVDEDAAMEEYLDEAETYAEDGPEEPSDSAQGGQEADPALAGYSRPLSVALASEPRADVRKVQRWLNMQGYSAGPVDGYYGASTVRSVRAFQRYAGLTSDGVVGPQTWTALQGWVY